ncbi:pleckstrin homology domain-containing family S member 1-like [Xyrichtys novacula]|uniref:Pleckstrin homology domain-containing family S member 1-like n=1 Tax=Xyrichtys novacula TaxID=13765 RepID=A0AAV1H4V3_XYRNO|nr:pleckstrin homology domain-containing family S member 1-like [Xyrichtys novacula]
MLKSQKSIGGNAVFYRPVGGTTEIRSGYLYKSPPPKRLKAESWKRRYFVLFKISEQEHQLKYFRNPQEKDRPLGGIDLSHISLLNVNPQNHQRWGWVEKSLKCSPSCVLYIKAANRDYFLVGDTTEEVDGWFFDLFCALQNRPYKIISPEVQPHISICTYIMFMNVFLFLFQEVLKIRSMSDPFSICVDGEPERVKDDPKRRKSMPVDPDYDYPASYFRQQEVTKGTLMRSIDLVYVRHKTQISPLPTCDEESPIDDRENRLSTDFSSSSSDNGAMSPVEMMETQNSNRLDKQSSTESLDTITPMERDFEIKQADLKKHLTLTEVDGKPCVSGWTGQPQSVCLFHKGDQILAINDLHTCNVDEFNMFLNKSLKNDVKVTILRLPGCQPLHSPNILCID